MLKIGINEKISNAEYHGDRNFLSSSALKLILKDSEEFHRQYILEQRENVQKNAFDEGSLVHAMILEPEIVAEEFAFYPGFRKAGNDFKLFLQDNPGKIIISEAQRVRCEKYVESHNKREAAVSLLKNGIPEHTLCEELLGVKIKVRPDYINVEEGYIVDVKTSRHSVDKEAFSYTMEDYGYALSAVLYCEVAKKIYNKDFDFYFNAISKQDLNCEVFKVSERTYEKGKQEVYSAIQKYKKCKSTNEWTKQKKLNIVEIVNNDYEILEV